MRIALHQSGVPGPETLDDAARRAAARGARLLLTPELSLTGYALADPAEAAQPADGPGPAAVAAIARRHGVAVVHGYPERGEDGAVHNSVQLIGPEGDLRANYRKTHLYGPYERAHYTAGSNLCVQTELDGLTLGLLVCYDVEFPEAVRAHALAGTDVLLVPTALMRPYDTVATTLVPARAVESQLYVAYANRVGREGEFDFAGLSCLAAPDGTVPARADGSSSALLLADADLAALRASRERNPYLADRRPELYPAWSRTDRTP
ncbi:carbon-nitrogen hydrolase family protein [Streptomyces albus]|uniref:carbon-nitrogen hydrolase family protein n=1 Tax=Streptomyces albus TaxID=1888 RepID=UPI0024AD13D3|nr:carbon-nitrogen hydrolase family protein [Streptomyces albus]MDI6411270.1 carbon-nitrogen hydrolase family protein [Streptomyces albus]